MRVALAPQEADAFAHKRAPEHLRRAAVVITLHRSPPAHADNLRPRDGQRQLAKAGASQ